MKKDNIYLYIYIYLNHFCTIETNTKCKSTIFQFKKNFFRNQTKKKKKIPQYKNM